MSKQHYIRRLFDDTVEFTLKRKGALVILCEKRIYRCIRRDASR